MFTSRRTCLFLLVFVSTYSGVTALSCFECNDIFKPYFCDIVTLCAAGEECFVDQYVTSSGKVLYTSGCRSTQRCGVTKRDIGTMEWPINEDQSSDIITCSNCCKDKDFCNLEGCGQTAIERSLRGPFCFDCSKQDRQSCRHITQCDINYSCELTTEVHSGITLYNSHCVHTLSSPNCNGTTQGSIPSVIGKRGQSSTDFCPKCCDEDFCNEDCLERQVVNGNWANWGSWGSCSVTCGTGTHGRTRTCTNPAPLGDGLDCVGNASETQPCTSSTVCPVDGMWASWGAWEHCSVTCGKGRRSRQRTCTNPSSSNGGHQCFGAPTYITQCIAPTQCPVDGNWAAWGAWDDCSATCGQGMHSKRRTCSNPQPSNGGHQCHGEAIYTSQCSAPTQCPVNGGFSHWSTWGQCDVTCGSSGTQVRTRLCNKPVPAHGGDGCKGDSSDTRTCPHLAACVYPNGGYSNWETWSACPFTCGGSGMQSRHRACLHSPCTGKDADYRSCTHQHACPVNGGYSGWSAWSACSNTCGVQGQHTRTRSCTKPPPSHGGRQCIGPDHDTRNCAESATEFSCLSAGSSYTTWSAWTSCSRSCGSGGRKHRTKSCFDSNHHLNQSLCTQPLVQQVHCSSGDCPTVNGGWSSWNSWSHCTSSCGQGYQSRYRYCTHPKPSGDGLDCQGENHLRQACDHTGSCTDSGYSAWTSWGRCSHPCGILGTKSRTRICHHDFPNHGHCQGSTVERIPCNTNVTCGAANTCEATPGYHLYSYHTHASSTTAYICIHYSNVMRSWTRASQACQSEGGTLGKFDTWEEEKAAVVGQIHAAYPRFPNTKIWIGLRYSGGSWTWENGRSIGYFAKQKLASHFFAVPAEFTHGACVVDNGANWSLAQCDTPHYYMCEKYV